MTDPRESGSPVPRWLHAWALLTLAVTLALLVLGQLVTSFRAGMADPIWPTEPWYLFVVGWQEPNRGYLIEHAHRIAGWTVGGLSIVLALGFWWTEPRKIARWGGGAALVVLVFAFLAFHGAMRTQKHATEITWPSGLIGTLVASLVVVLAIGGASVAAGIRGSGLRLLAVVTLVAVMVQGLLGGFRVRLDALLGPELAPVHGVFAQVVFCLLVSLAVLTARVVPAGLPAATRRPLGRLSLALVGLLFVQLVWGAMVRHTPNSLNQRLHLLTAFLVVAAAVWLLRVGFTTAARPRVAAAGWLLGVLLVLQVALGVEAWMGKFGDEARRGKPAAAYLPEAEKVTEQQAAIRTAHTLVGTGVLAAAVMLALRVRQRVPGEGWGEGYRGAADRPAVVATRTPALASRVQPGETP
jgi:heme A synthase